MSASRFILYARKSTESDDRQVQSIGDQTKIMSDTARTHGLKLAKTLGEAKSASTPGIRPVFDDMLNRIERGEADGILCWHLNRLSRNPVDSGRLSWMLQKGIIKEIRTNEKSYFPNDNVVIMAVESGAANQFSRDLSKTVRRGIQMKLERGEWPGVAPIGYMNKLDDHTIVPDPDRFPLIRRAWDLYLTGYHTVPAILKIINNEWGFRTLKRKRSGNKPIAISGLYKIFSNPFYKGTMLHEGVNYRGKHTPMVTAEEFERAQILLGRKSFSRTRKHAFNFTGFIRCGECGCLICAQKKYKTIKETTIKCTQRHAVREEELEKQVLSLLGKVTILPEFRDWALEILRTSHEQEVEERNRIMESQQRALASTRSELDN